MVVNFRTRGISKSVRNLIRTPILKKNQDRCILYIYKLKSF
jgi:hypothetical protein